MDQQMKLLVSMLKEIVTNNLQIIKKNEENIRRILTLPVSIERSNLLAENFNINRRLLEENHDSLNLELQVINYLNKFKDKMKHQPNNQSIEQDFNDENLNQQSSEIIGNTEHDPESISDEDILRLTLSGKIAFDVSHPFYRDEDFLDELLEGYKKVENYEMCSTLMKIKERR